MFYVVGTWGGMYGSESGARVDPTHARTSLNTLLHITVQGDHFHNVNRIDAIENC